ncbi:MAG: hypothetical protein SOW03_02200 [Campylobacter sp.]|nr:hypothetical protein [Campylobacteraceae bacterium]MDY2635130.1 hypothetical protein [Campylobacter sp.]
MDSPVALAKISHRFLLRNPVGSTLRLEKSARNFASCYRRHDPTASPAPLFRTLGASTAL